MTSVVVAILAAAGGQLMVGASALGQVAVAEAMADDGGDGAFVRLAAGTEPPAAVGAGSVAGPRPTAGGVFAVDFAALRRLFAGAPVGRLDAELNAYGMRVLLPGATGDMMECLVAESAVMEPGLAKKFPELRTYVVKSVDGRASGRVELAPRGMTAMLRTAEGVWMIDPWQSADAGHVVSYWLSDLPGGGDWTCHTTEGKHGDGAHVDDVDDGEAAPEGAPLPTAIRRTVRIAMACTGEYGAHQSAIQGRAPNMADAMAAIVTVVARTNVVFEADLGVHFSLIANNDQLVFIDPATDPYSTSCDGVAGADCSGEYLSQNITTLSQRIGNANFEVGHLLTRVFGGVAYLSSVCTGNKAGGISGVPRGGDIDPLSALVVIHELGHQFGARHTFSGTRGRCGNNATLATAWEAGSGSSPMAYAGGCPVGDAPPSDNIVQLAEPFFHHGSVLEMQTFLAGAVCPVQTVTSNFLPFIISTSASAAIPPGTPFVLTASAGDPNGDSLTYSWEQFDSGVRRPLSGVGSLDTGFGSLFRIFRPVAVGQRTFPKMADVLSGVPTPGEQLPTAVTTGRRFRVLVRDNSPLTGGTVISPFVTLSIPTNASPFVVVSPAAGARLRAGAATVTWSVGGTNLAPIACPTVTVRLSTDAGATFPTVLGTFANSGSALVTLPDASAAARVRIDSVGNIFFAVSRPFTLLPACLADVNGDRVVDGSDFIAFINSFSVGDPAVDVLADIAGTGAAGNQPDGAVDGSDFVAFINAFSAGC